jgi:MFS transporter, DHA2 family, lincomycin resistance protein
MTGLGLMMTPLLTASLGVLPPHLYSHGSAIMTTLQQVAGAASTAGLVTIATVFSTAPSGSPDAGGLQAAFMVGGGIGILAVIISLFIRRPPADGAAAAAHGHAAAEGPSPAAAEQPLPPVAAGTTAPAEVPVDPATSERPLPVANGSAGSGHGGPSLRGSARTHDGARAVVTLIDTNGAQRGHARAGDDGAYALDVPSAGVWYVVVSAPGHRPRADRLVVGEHDDAVTHDIAMQSASRDGDQGTDTRPFAAVGPTQP